MSEERQHEHAVDEAACPDGRRTHGRGSPATGAALAQDLKIGVVNPFSGGMALYGDEMTRGYEIAAPRRMPRRRPRAQDRSRARQRHQPAEAIAAVEQLVGRDKVDLLSGTYVTAISNAASEAALNNASSTGRPTRSPATSPTRPAELRPLRARQPQLRPALGGGRAPARDPEARQGAEGHQGMDRARGFGLRHLDRQGAGALLKAAGVGTTLSAHSARAIDLSDSILRAKTRTRTSGSRPATSPITTCAAHRPRAGLPAEGDDPHRHRRHLRDPRRVGKDFLDGILLVSIPAATSARPTAGGGAFLKAYRENYGRDPIAPQR